MTPKVGVHSDDLLEAVNAQVDAKELAKVPSRR